MISWEQCGLIILASGQSARFGDTDKLTAPFCGAPLAAHAAQLARKAPFGLSIGVVPPGRPELNRIFNACSVEPLINERPEAGQGPSLATGAKAVAEHGCDAVFVVLADMPLVRVAHLDRLRHGIGVHDAAFAFNGLRRSPPALFRKSVFRLLMNLSGDQGAREAASSIDSIAIDMLAEDLTDIDTAEDLRRLEAIITDRG